VASQDERAGASRFMAFAKRLFGRDRRPPDFPWDIPDVAETEAQSIVEEVVRRGRRNEWLGNTWWRIRSRWMVVHYLIGMPAALLAATSGGLALKESERAVLTGVLALVAAALGALLTWLNPTAKAANAVTHAYAYWRISSWTRVKIAADLPNATTEHARRILEDLHQQEMAAMRVTEEQFTTRG
jgi:hypothetical protein